MVRTMCTFLQHIISYDHITSAFLSAVFIVLSSSHQNIQISLDIRQIPFMKDRTMGSGMPSARAGVVEDLLPPLFVPKAPERNYFLFGQVHYTTLHYTTLHYTALFSTTSIMYLSKSQYHLISWVTSHLIIVYWIQSQNIYLFISYRVTASQPFDTRELNIYNKKECKKIYGEVKGSVEDGLQVGWVCVNFRTFDTSD